MAQTITIDRASWEMTIIALGSLSVSVDVASQAALKAAGEVLLFRVRANANRTDNGLEDLRKKDHPYARRHGVIQADQLGPAFVKRPYMVHRRSGAFLNAIKLQSSTGGRGSGGRFTGTYSEVVVSPTVPWVKYVIQGTRVMLPRDIVWETAHEPDTKRHMQIAVIDVLGRQLRTKAAVRF